MTTQCKTDSSRQALLGLFLSLALMITQARGAERFICGTTPIRPVSTARVTQLAIPINLPPADTLSEPTTIDLLVLYTPATVNGQGNEEGVRRRILESVVETNYRLTNSLINVRINPIHIRLINYAETGDLPRDLANLGTGSGTLSLAHALRSDYKADLVCLVTETENLGIAGAAGDITPTKGNPGTGFVVVRRISLGRGNMMLAHELGHLLGCAHDREHADDDQDGYYESRKPYIFGHRFEVGGVTYTDVMSYEPGIPVPYFSNPRLALDGVPLGVAAEQTQPADGARTINEIAPYVANYRQALSRIEFAQADFSLYNGLGNVLLRRKGNITTPAEVTIHSSSGGSLTVAFPANESVVSLPFGVDADPLRLSLSSVVGDHGIGSQDTAEVTFVSKHGLPGGPLASFPDGAVSVLESAGTAEVRAVGNAWEVASLSYHTLDGTAVAGQDYQAVSGTVAITVDAPELKIAIPIIHNPASGRDRTFSMVVGNRTNSVRILDQQRPGSLAHVKNVEADGRLNSITRADGKVLVWGDFSRIASIDRTGIALLNADGTVDSSFRPPEILLGHRRIENIGGGTDSFNSNARIGVVRIQTDGKMLLAGSFSRVNGQPRSMLMRLHGDGTLDADFARDLRFDGGIRDVAIQSDGKILVGGTFEHINGQRRPFIARLNPDGAVDHTFQPAGGPTSEWTTQIWTMALQDDGRILIGGYFQKLDGHPMLNIGRLNSDGTRDSSFKLASGASGPVWRIRMQPDGRIVVGGVFDQIGGRNYKRLARLNTDGSLDLSFRPSNPDADVFDVLCLPDGRLLITGVFTRVASQNRRFLAMLNPDGSLDSQFDPGVGPDNTPGAGFGCEAASPHGSGMLYLTGPFARFNDVPASSVVQLRLGDIRPRFSTPKQTQGEFQITLHGFPGGLYPLETSTDLTRWEAAGEVIIAGFDRRVTLQTPASLGVQFFRVKRQPSQ